MVQKKQQSVVTGHLTMTSGEPVADAHVAVIAMSVQPAPAGDLSPTGEVLAEGWSADDGRYRLNLEGVSSKTHRYANVIARTDGMAVAWKQINLDVASVEGSLEIAPQELIKGRLVDTEGLPAADVELHVVSVEKRSDGSLARRDGVSFRGERAPAAWLQPSSTDGQGRFTVYGVPQRHGVFLNVVGSDRFAPQGIVLNTGMPEQRCERDGTHRPLVKNVDAGEEAVLPLARAQPFEGVVTFEDTGQPAPHARLTIWASQEEPPASMISVAGMADSEGRYRMIPQPGIRFGVIAYPPAGVPYLARQTPSEKAIRWREGDTSRQVNVSLPRGVLVRGKVVETGTNTPVQGAAIQYVPEHANNPNTADNILTGGQAVRLSNDQGEFGIAVLPGPGRLLVNGPQGKYVVQEFASRQLFEGQPGGERSYAHAVYEVNPDSDTQPIDVTISVHPSATAAGQIVDAKGQLVDEALVISRLVLFLFPGQMRWRGHMPPTLGGRFELGGFQEGHEYPVHFLDAKRRLGATVILRADSGSKTVVLEPCGEAQARFVDPEGQPHVGFDPGLHLVVTPGAHEHDHEAAKRGELLADADFVANIDRTNYWPGSETDNQGNVTFPALIPGATYRLSTYEEGEPKVIKQFVIESGQQLKLGDIAIDLND